MAFNYNKTKEKRTPNHHQSSTSSSFNFHLYIKFYILLCMRSSEECFNSSSSSFIYFFHFCITLSCIALHCIALNRWHVINVMSLVFWSRRFIDMLFSIVTPWANKHILSAWLFACFIGIWHVNTYRLYTIHHILKWFTQLSYRNRQPIPILFTQYAYNFAFQFSKQANKKSVFFSFDALSVNPW